MTVVAEARLIYADLENNNNKFWNAQVLADGTVNAQWGRVGETGASGQWSGGVPYLDRKVREKEKKGYVRQRVITDVPVTSSTFSSHVQASTKSDLARIAAEQVSTGGNATVLALLKRLADINVHSILSQTTLKYDTSRGTFSTPLGIITASAILDARAQLDVIGNAVLAQDWENTAFKAAINRFLMLVPSDIGRNRMSARDLFPSVVQIQEKNDLLDALEVSLNNVLNTPVDGSITKPADPKLFDLILHLVEDGAEIDRIKKKYRSTLQSMHACSHLDVKTVYSVEITSMKTAFDAYAPTVGNIKELYHGTKSHNVLSILKSGMKIIPSNSPHVTGRLFGGGSYFSDQSTKSLNYAYGAAPGQSYSGYSDNCFMFLADVAMGKEYYPKALYENLPKPGYDSTFAKPSNIPSLRNNEMIVYRENQVNLTRLIEFSRGGK